MTIDEAIRVHTVLIKAPVIKDDEVCVKALKLGIEALKRHKEITPLFTAAPYPPLPGETKD